MSVTSFRLPALQLSRREALIGGAASLLLPQLARAQTKLQVTEGNVAPLPIAIPNFVAGAPAGGGGGGGGAPAGSKKPKRSGLFLPVDQAPLLQKKKKKNLPPHLQSGKNNKPQNPVT